MTGIPVAAGELVGIDYLNEVTRAHWRDPALVTISNSTTETDLLGSSGVTVPANTIGTDGVLRITVIGDFLNNTGSETDNLTLTVHYGSTSVNSDIFQPTPSTRRYLVIATFYVIAENATNAQAVAGKMLDSEASGGVEIVDLPGANSTQGWQDFTVDSTAAQTLRVTATLNAASTSLVFRKRACFVETFA